MLAIDDSRGATSTTPKKTPSTNIAKLSHPFERQSWTLPCDHPQISRRIPKGNSSNILNIPSPPKEPKTNAALMNRTQYSKDVLGGWFMRDAPALVLIFLSLFKPLQGEPFMAVYEWFRGARLQSEH